MCLTILYLPQFYFFMIKSIITTFIYIFLSCHLFSQTITNSPTDTTWNKFKPVKYTLPADITKQLTQSIETGKNAKIEIIASDKITNLINRHIQINDSLAVIPGYRIHIFSISGVNSISKAEEVKANFIRLYPDYVVHLDFFSPNYKVRCGAFRTKLEALKFLSLISTDFPGSYLITDDVELKELGVK